MGINYKHKIIRVVFISTIFILFSLTFWPFLTELLLAALFAFAFHDFVEKMLAKKIKRKYASLIVTLSILFFIAAPLTFIILKTISAIKKYSQVGFINIPLYQSSEKLFNELTTYLVSIAERFSLDISKIPNPSEILGHYSTQIASYATESITKVPQVALSFLVFFLGLYYFLSESQKIKEQFFKFDLLSELETNKIIIILKSSSYMTLAISLFIAAIQAFIISVFSYFSGFEEFFMIFIITFVFALIPLVGSAPTPLFLMLIAFMQSNTGAAITMLVAGIIAGSIDNFIKPILLSSAKESLSPILSLITLIGAILVYGPVGILIGPIITQLAINIIGILRSDDKSGEFIADSDL